MTCWLLHSNDDAEQVEKCYSINWKYANCDSCKNNCYCTSEKILMLHNLNIGHWKLRNTALYLKHWEIIQQWLNIGTYIILLHKLKLNFMNTAAKFENMKMQIEECCTICLDCLIATFCFVCNEEIHAARFISRKGATHIFCDKRSNLELVNR